MNVLIAGGGTAGHVYPALALADRLAGEGHAVRFVGTPTGQEASLVPEAGHPFVPIEARPFERSLSVRALAGPLWAMRSVGTCRPLTAWADVVVGMGGYVSVPVALAALRTRRPLVLHEQNAVPGLANRTFARPARAVALSFAEARRALPRRARTVVTGNPVRPRILEVPLGRDGLAEQARAELDLRDGAPTVVVFGGSQGALHVNRSAVDALRWIGSGVQLVLLAGRTHVETVERSVPADRASSVRVLAYLERMELAYAVADLVVARAGATTVAELAVCGIPSLLIPYPYATGRHQEANARALQRAGAATVLLDDELDGRVLAERIERLVADRERLREMSERARTWSRPDATEALAATVVEAGAQR